MKKCLLALSVAGAMQAGMISTYGRDFSDRRYCIDPSLSRKNENWKGQGKRRAPKQR